MLIRKILTIAVMLMLGCVPAALAQGGGNGGSTHN
jgi:hypothetical protein